MHKIFLYLASVGAFCLVVGGCAAPGPAAPSFAAMPGKGFNVLLKYQYRRAACTLIGVVLKTDRYGPSIGLRCIRICCANSHFGPQSLPQSLLAFPPFIRHAGCLGASGSNKHPFHALRLSLRSQHAIDRRTTHGTFVAAVDCWKIAACRRSTLMLSEFAELEVVNVLIAFAIVCSLYFVCLDTWHSNENKPSPRHFL